MSAEPQKPTPTHPHTFWWRQTTTSPTGNITNSVQYGSYTASKGKVETNETVTTAVSHDGAVCATRTPKPGDDCLICHQGTLAYDGLFVLSCDQCGQVAESGCFS